ncbi:MAG: hypothetical protein Ta2E_00730 [Mycoplasmoidaceae bacterium]|nr:MAG: hypothetical protein Ta2E_00730 [Mycoplasmoidaceae bacterium]
MTRLEKISKTKRRTSIWSLDKKKIRLYAGIKNGNAIEQEYMKELIEIQNQESCSERISQRKIDDEKNKEIISERNKLHKIIRVSISFNVKSDADEVNNKKQN